MKLVIHITPESLGPDADELDTRYYCDELMDTLDARLPVDAHVVAVLDDSERDDDISPKLRDVVEYISERVLVSGRWITLAAEARHDAGGIG